MKSTATFVLRRTTDLVSHFRSRPRHASAAFAQSTVKSRPKIGPISTEVLVRKLARPVMQRHGNLAM